MQELYNIKDTPKLDFFNNKKFNQKQARSHAPRKENYKEAKYLEGSFSSIETNTSWIILLTLVFHQFR